MSVEESPEFQKALRDGAEKALNRLNSTKPKCKDGVEVKAEALRSRAKERETEFGEVERWWSDPHMREITANLKRKNGLVDLVCPVCGEGDNGNRMNDIPICFMNAKHKAKGVDGPVPLMTPEKAKDWKPPRKRPTLQELIEESTGILKDRVIIKRREKRRLK